MVRWKQNEWVSPQSKLAPDEKIHKFLRRFNLLAKRLAAVGEDIQELADDLALMVEGGILTPGGAVGKGQADDDSDAILKKQGEFGVGRFAIEEQDGKKHLVTLGEMTFSLSPMLGRLLRFLSADTESSPDAFVGWKNLELLTLLLKKPNDENGRHATINLVCRLKRELGKHGASPYLIESDDGPKYRLRLRRKTSL